ncbi:MAG: DUF4870 domain-containing protein [Bacteroidales bacterium]|nr:DUF4870 domain-containing protein [Bacteroidales bacterium]
MSENIYIKATEKEKRKAYLCHIYALIGFIFGLIVNILIMVYNLFELAKSDFVIIFTNFFLVSSFAGIVFLFLCSSVGPFLVWRKYKNISPYITEHSKTAFNFHCSVSIYFLIAVLLVFIVVGLFLIIALIFFVFSQLEAAMKAARNGDIFKHKFAINFLYS